MSGVNWQACASMLKGMTVYEHDPDVGNAEPAVVEEAWIDGEMVKARVKNRRGQTYDIAWNMGYHGLSTGATVSLEVYPLYAGGSSFTFANERDVDRSELLTPGVNET